MSIVRTHGTSGRATGSGRASALSLVVGLAAVIAAGQPGRAPGLAAARPAARASSRSAAARLLSDSARVVIRARRAARPGAGLQPDDALPRPSWWNGSCDGASSGRYPGSRPNGAVFDGLVSCGPGPNQGGSDHLVHFFPGAWGEYEWECVELSMRWMYQAWGVPPYGANGNDVVANYPEGAPGYPALQRIANGTPHEAPQPGDVVSVANADQFGHTEVVATSAVNGQGDGTLKAITENWAPHNDGWVTLSVTHWVVSDGVPGDKVLGWLHNPRWSLQTPVVWEVTPTGVLQVRATGTLEGRATSVASGIESADVIGGQGFEPAPLAAALTTTGSLVAGFLTPGNGLRPVAKEVASYAVSSGAGRAGSPVLAWVTPSGALEVLLGSLGAKPVTLLGSGVRQVVLAPHSGPGDALLGVITDAGSFETAEGDLRRPLTWTTVAPAASAIGLAGGGGTPARAVEAYTDGGVLYERQGSAPFSPVAESVRQFSLASVGATSTPFLAWVTGAGALYAVVGSRPVVHVSDGVASVMAAGGATTMGFPLLTFVDTAGRLWAEEGTLSSGLVRQATSVTSGGASDLTVT